jgi:hypothetical protein
LFYAALDFDGVLVSIFSMRLVLLSNYSTTKNIQHIQPRQYPLRHSTAIVHNRMTRTQTFFSFFSTPALSVSSGKRPRGGSSIFFFFAHSFTSAMTDLIRSAKSGVDWDSKRASSVQHSSGRTAVRRSERAPTCTTPRTPLLRDRGSRARARDDDAYRLLHYLDLVLGREAPVDNFRRKTAGDVGVRVRSPGNSQLSCPPLIICRTHAQLRRTFASLTRTTISFW